MAGGSWVFTPQQSHGLSPVRPAAELVAAGAAKRAVQLGEERAGTEKVQNINKSRSAAEVWGTAVPDRIDCDCAVFAKQPAEKNSRAEREDVAEQGLGMWPSES